MSFGILQPVGMQGFSADRGCGVVICVKNNLSLLCKNTINPADFTCFIERNADFLEKEKNSKKTLDISKKIYYNNQVADESGKIWELSSAGRASALQAEGHRFEPYSSHIWPSSSVG